MDNIFCVQVSRFQINNPCCYVLQGWFPKNKKGDAEFTAAFAGAFCPLSITHKEGIEVRKKYLRLENNLDHEYYIWIELPRQLAGGGSLTVYENDGRQRKKVFQITAARLIKQRAMVDSYIENVIRLEDGKLSVSGWAASVKGADFFIYNQHGQKLAAETKTISRKDVVYNYPELELPYTLGFECIFDGSRTDKFTLAIRGDDKETTYSYRIKAALQGKGLHATANLWVKAAAYFKRNGFGKTINRVIEKLTRQDIKKINYNAWLQKHLPTQEVLQMQRETKFKTEPLFSIVVPLYQTPEKYLRPLVDSVRAQTYGNWELCLSDGSGKDSLLKDVLTQLKREDSRIRVICSDKVLRIAENTNRAVEMVTGDFIIFADHDDLLTSDALYECAKALNQNADIEMIYSDEDKVSMDGQNYFEPHFKPDFNKDLLYSMNYFCHLVAVSTSLAAKAGGLDPAFDGAQDYDFVLRCTEHSDKIHHIPRILYHWRAHLDSTAENPESKRYAFEAGQRAIQAHYDRMGIPAAVVPGEFLGIYRSIYEIKNEPLISIVIPNKDHSEDLDKCISSIMDKSTYRNYEFIIVENNSTNKATFAYYKELEANCSNVKVIYWKEDFNYSLINNFGVEHAKGEYILLLNNDTEIINPDCLKELLGHCRREDVGIVGARLYFEDDVIQHAGVVMGFGGMAGHIFIGSKRGDQGYLNRIICACDYSAVTAACLMVKKSIFMKVGGMNPEYRVAFNDIDFCLKVRALGKLVVYNPYAELYHYESKSRGQEDTPEKVERFNSEAERLMESWVELADRDPYYNPNLSLDKADMSMKVI